MPANGPVSGCVFPCVFSPGTVPSILTGRTIIRDVAFVGDSFTVALSTDQKKLSARFPAWAQAMSPGTLDIIKNGSTSYQFATSGYDSAEVQGTGGTDHVSQALATACDTVCLLVGTNDYGVRSVGDYITNVETIIATVKAAGRNIIVCSVAPFPASYAGDQTARHAYIAAQNTALASAVPAAGGIWCDWTTEMESSAGVAPDSLFYDQDGSNLHFGDLGSAIAGQRLYNTISGYLTGASIWDGEGTDWDWVSDAPLMEDLYWQDGSTVYARQNVGAAYEFRFVKASGTTYGTLSFESVAGESYKKAVIPITGVTSNDTAFWADYPNELPDASPGDMLRAVCQIDLPSTSDQSWVYMKLQSNGTNALDLRTLDPHVATTGSIQEPGRTLTLVTPWGALPADATYCAPNILLNGTGTFKISRYGIQKQL